MPDPASTLQSPGSAAVPDDLGPWFHNLHLDDGRTTKGDLGVLGDFPRWKWDELAPHLPEQLDGLRVLDIGCNAGFYSFALARRGADVLGIDHDPHYLRQARWATDHIDTGTGSVSFEAGDVFGLIHERRTFDLILFLGVLYHLRYPLLAIDAVAERLNPNGTLVFQTLCMPGPTPTADQHPPENVALCDRKPMCAPHYPKLAFIEHRLADDPTNWFAANPAACEAMLRSTGLTGLDRLSDELWLARAPEAGVRASRHWNPRELDQFRDRAAGDTDVDAGAGGAR